MEMENAKNGAVGSRLFRRRNDIERTNIGVLHEEAELRTAVEASGLGIFDYYPLTGELYWSHAAKEHFGLSPDAHVNYNVFLVGLHPDDRAQVDNLMHKTLLRENEGKYSTEYRTIGIEDGKERWISARGQAFFNERGEAVRFIGTTADISEKKRMEKFPLENGETYRLLFEKSPLPKWVFDLGSTAFLEVNDAVVECYGYSREELLHMTLADIRTAEEFENFRQAVNDARAEGKRFEGRVQTKHRKKNNEIIDVDVRYTEISYNGSQCALAVVLDLTERKKAEETLKHTVKELERTVEDLERSNRELQQFAYVASHDLQEPLRTMASYVDLLALKYKGKLDETADKYISYSVEGANRMSSLINDLLAYSRVGTRGKKFSPVQMSSVVQQSIANLKRAIKESDALVTTDDLPLVNGDEIQLIQLLQNLIGNAVKFRKKDVPLRIHVGAENRGNDWAFGVHDNGIGIEPRFFDRIFLIFQRLNTGEQYPGTGVGLAICKRIVERHGGHIWVESRPGEGEGSTFYFTLPAG